MFVMGDVKGMVKRGHRFGTSFSLKKKHENRPRASLDFHNEIYYRYKKPNMIFTFV